MRKLIIPTGYMPVPYHAKYAVNQCGTVIDIAEGNYPIMPISDGSNGTGNIMEKECQLDGIWHKLHELVMDAYVGHLDVPIIKSVPIPQNVKQIYYDLQYDGMQDQFHIFSGVRFAKIAEFPGYAISDNGVIIHFKTLEPVYRLFVDSLYYKVNLIGDDGEYHTARVSDLVYRAFVGEIPEGLVVAYKDDMPYNNHYTNLELIDQVQNIKRTYVLDDNGFSDEVIHAICKLMEQDVYPIDIAEQLGIPYTQRFVRLVNRLRHGTSKAVISSQYEIPSVNPTSSRLMVPTSTREAILNDARAGLRIQEIHEKYPDMKEHTIRTICDAEGVKLNIRKFTPAQVEEILKYYHEHGFGATCAQYGISGKTLSVMNAGVYFDTRPAGFTLGDKASRRKPLTPEEVADVEAQLKDGVHPTILAKKYHISRAAIFKIKARLGLTHPQKTVPPEDRVIIAQRYRNGERYDALAEEYGVSEKTIWNIINEMKNN